MWGRRAGSETGVQALTCVAMHPEQPNMALTGGCDGVLGLWDLRYVG